MAEDQGESGEGKLREGLADTLTQTKRANGITTDRARANTTDIDFTYREARYKLYLQAQS
jgi:hypothetical protein